MEHEEARKHYAKARQRALDELRDGTCEAACFQALERAFLWRLACEGHGLRPSTWAEILEDPSTPSQDSDLLVSSDNA